MSINRRFIIYWTTGVGQATVRDDPRRHPMAPASARAPDVPELRPFTIAVDDRVLLDLERRLDAARWPDEIAGPAWAFGTDRQYLRKLVDYWRAGYDWRAQEAMLNRFRHFTVPIDGIDLH